LSRQNLRYRALAIMLAAMLLPGRAQAQTEEQWDSCYGIGVPAPNVQPPEVLISGCTAVIQSGIHSGRNLVVAFTNRGVGYRQTFERDRAFMDFEQAIALDADYLPAYDQTGQPVLGHRRLRACPAGPGSDHQAETARGRPGHRRSRSRAAMRAPRPRHHAAGVSSLLKSRHAFSTSATAGALPA
jgi:hypothetical protein